MRGKKHRLNKSQTIHEGTLTDCDNVSVVDVELPLLNFETATHHGYLM